MHGVEQRDIGEYYTVVSPVQMVKIVFQVTYHLGSRSWVGGQEYHGRYP